MATTALMLVGAASMTIAARCRATRPPTSPATCALAFLCLGIRLPLAWRRAVVALGFGVIGFVLSGGLDVALRRRQP